VKSTGVQLLKPPGFPEAIPAVQVSLQKTSQDNAWLGPRFTVRLVSELPAIRVHVRGAAGAAAQSSRAGSRSVGRWFAIGDVILTRDQYAARHALPGRFAYQDEWILPVGSILNVGLASPLFGQTGGALQAEWLGGPPLQSRPIAGFWSNRAGRA
jgi:hypothetical protein